MNCLYSLFMQMWCLCVCVLVWTMRWHGKSSNKRDTRATNFRRYAETFCTLCADRLAAVVCLSSSRTFGLSSQFDSCKLTHDHTIRINRVPITACISTYVFSAIVAPSFSSNVWLCWLRCCRSRFFTRFFFFL